MYARIMIPAMEPTLTTDPELADILAELVSREPIFHHPRNNRYHNSPKR
jgi:hypothetical protein